MTIYENQPPLKNEAMLTIYLVYESYSYQIYASMKMIGTVHLYKIKIIQSILQKISLTVLINNNKF